MQYYGTSSSNIEEQLRYKQDIVLYYAFITIPASKYIQLTTGASVVIVDSHAVQGQQYAASKNKL